MKIQLPSTENDFVLEINNNFPKKLSFVSLKDISFNNEKLEKNKIIFLEINENINFLQNNNKNLILTEKSWIEVYKYIKENLEETFVYPPEATIAIAEYKKQKNKLKF